MVEVLAQGSRVEVEDGTEVMRFRIADATVTPEVSLRAGFQFAAFFGSAAFKAAPAAISLWSYGVRDIVESFASDFRQPASGRRRRRSSRAPARSLPRRPVSAPPWVPER
jgi:hypothetical protein